jgi:hypothetical protein
MTAATSIVAAIDMRVQPSWRWAEEDAAPSRAATLKGYDRVYGEEFRSLNTHASLVADLRRLNIRAVFSPSRSAGAPPPRMIESLRSSRALPTAFSLVSALPIRATGSQRCARSTAFTVSSAYAASR